MLYIRGAITADNTTDDIGGKAVELVTQILAVNNLAVSSVSAMLFTVTKDLTAANPCTAVRKTLAADSVAFMCMQEADVDGAMPSCIRVLVIAEGDGEPRFVYSGGAQNLRK